MHLQLQLANNAFETHSLQISVGDNRYFFIIKFTCLVTTIVQLVDSFKLDQKPIRGCSTPYEFLVRFKKYLTASGVELVVQ